MPHPGSGLGLSDWQVLGEGGEEKTSAGGQRVSEGVGKGRRFGERSLLELRECCWSAARCEGSELFVGFNENRNTKL